MLSPLSTELGLSCATEAVWRRRQSLERTADLGGGVVGRRLDFLRGWTKAMKSPAAPTDRDKPCLVIGLIVDSGPEEAR